MVSPIARQHRASDASARRARPRFATGSASCVAISLGLVTLLGLVPTVAHAYEDRVTLELGTGFALAPSGGTLRYGPPVALESLIGLSPAWSLGLRASYLPLFPRPATQVGTLGLEACYQLDVVHVVPRISFGAAGLVGGVDGTRWGGFAFTARVGIDWLLDQFLLGLDVRGSVLPLSNATGIGHGFVEVGLRVGVLFDRF